MEEEFSFNAADAVRRRVCGAGAGLRAGTRARIRWRGGGRAIIAPALIVDARAIGRSGIGRYARALISRFVARGTFAEVVLCGDVTELTTFVRSHAAGARIERLAGGHYSAASVLGWRTLGPHLPRSAVVFFPHWDAPPWQLPMPSVVTVHDLIQLHVRESAPAWKRVGMRWWLSRACRQATRILCDTNHAREDLAAFAPASVARIRVVELGVAEAFRDDGVSRAADPPLPDGIARPYLLAVGAGRAHKNLEGAIDVLARLAPRDPALTLVVAGEDAPHWRRVMAHAEQQGVAERVRVVGVVTDDVLRALYRSAEALLFPSRHEGFGLPLLEAMSCGAPVVASNAASIPEVAGNAALLFAPDDAAGMADAVLRLRTDAALRSDLVARGRARAATFSWDRCAELTEAVLLEAAR